ncbi:MAG: molecular chaperone DnaK [Pseudomonadota bacterium]
MTVIGIDLGTTYSVMAYIKDGVPTIIPNAEGESLTPSIVGFDKEGHLFVGNLAKSRAVFEPENTVASIKRKMGTSYTCTLHGRKYTPTTISSFVLGKLKKDAEMYLGEKIREAVVTVPAYFSDIARQATKDAAEIAGLKVLRIINEPTAATLAYGLDQKEGELVMVWDLGGGTFDVSILEFASGVYEVKSTCGDMKLGGDDWRDVLVGHFKEEFKARVGSEIGKDPVALQRLSTAAENAKIELTDDESTFVNLPSTVNVGEHCNSNRISIDRSKFKKLTSHLCERLIHPARQALKDAGIDVKVLDKVILVGGATRMPMVRSRVAEFTGQSPFVDIDPDKVIAIGAAVQAGVLTGSLKNIVLVDVIPLSLGLETQGAIFTKLIERNSKIPTSKDRIFTTAEDSQSEVDIHVLQGERALVKDNISLGDFTLTGVPDAPKGVPKINVTFSVDVNGILNVQAEDVYSGSEKEMTVHSDRLSRDDIEKLIIEAEQHRDSDEETRNNIIARVELDRVVQGLKESIEEMNICKGTEVYIKIDNIIKEAMDIIDTSKSEEIETMTQKIKDYMDVVYEKWKRKKKG